MNQITRILEFDAGHRLVDHESKCANLHGHRYKAEITCRAEELDGIGRVVDFSVIKEKVGGWIDEHWDHNFLLNRQDPLLKAIRQLNTVCPLDHEVACWGDIVFHTKDPYLLDCNPTAENMARILFDKAVELLEGPKEERTSLWVVSVCLWETPNCHAFYSRPRGGYTE